MLYLAQAVTRPNYGSKHCLTFSQTSSQTCSGNHNNWPRCDLKGVAPGKINTRTLTELNASSSASSSGQLSKPSCLRLLNSKMSRRLGKQKYYPTSPPSRYLLTALATSFSCSSAMAVCCCRRRPASWARLSSNCRAWKDAIKERVPSLGP